MSLVDHQSQQESQRRSYGLGFILKCLLTIAASIAYPTSHTNANPQEVDAQIAILEKWIQTQKDTAELRRIWISNREQLEHEDALLAAEAEGLTNRIASLESINSNLRVKTEVLGTDIQNLREITAGAEQALEKHRAQLIALLPNLPPPLSQSITPKLTDDSVNSETLGAGYQVLISALSEIHGFARQAHRAVEIRDVPEGTPRQLETLYWGLNYAYSADKTGTYCQLGFATEEGWKWRNAHEHATVVRTFLDTHEGLLSPSFINLPVAFDE